MKIYYRLDGEDFVADESDIPPLKEFPTFKLFCNETQEQRKLRWAAEHADLAASQKAYVLNTVLALYKKSATGASTSLRTRSEELGASMQEALTKLVLARNLQRGHSVVTIIRRHKRPTHIPQLTLAANIEFAFETSFKPHTIYISAVPMKAKNEGT